MKVLVDEGDEPVVLGALPTDRLARLGPKMIELSQEVIGASLAAVLGQMYDLLAHAPEPPAGYNLSDVRFTLVINAAGEVSLLSALKGSLSGQAGIEFSLARHRGGQ